MCCEVVRRSAAVLIWTVNQPIMWAALLPRQHCGTPDAGGEEADTRTGEAVVTRCKVWWSDACTNSRAWRKCRTVRSQYTVCSACVVWLTGQPVAPCTQFSGVYGVQCVVYVWMCDLCTMHYSYQVAIHLVKRSYGSVLSQLLAWGTPMWMLSIITGLTANITI